MPGRQRPAGHRAWGTRLSTQEAEWWDGGRFHVAQHQMTVKVCHAQEHAVRAGGHTRLLNTGEG